MLHHVFIDKQIKWLKSFKNNSNLRKSLSNASKSVDKLIITDVYWGLRVFGWLDVLVKSLFHWEPIKDLAAYHNIWLFL